MRKKEWQQGLPRVIPLEAMEMVGWKIEGGRTKSIAINGQKLHEVRMLLFPHTPGTVSYLTYPKSRIRFEAVEGGLILRVPALLALELYRKGILPQNEETAFTLHMGGRKEGSFRVADFRYPNSHEIDDPVTIRLQYAEKKNVSKDRAPKADFTGTWNITEMELWDEEYLNIEVQAYIRITKKNRGEFQFGLVSGSIDGRIADCGGEKRLEFTWDGNDECDLASGSGWLRKKGEDMIEGEIAFHEGDRSRFLAKRAD